VSPMHCSSPAHAGLANSLSRAVCAGRELRAPHGRLMRRVRHLVSASPSLADPQTLLEQGLAERGESATHPTVGAHASDPAVAPRRVGARARSGPSEEAQSRAPMLRLASCAPSSVPPTFKPWAGAASSSSMARRHMRWDVANVFLKFSRSSRLGDADLTAPSPYALLPTIVSRCLQFHFAPLPQAAVKNPKRNDRSQARGNQTRRATRRGQSGPRHGMDVDAAAQRRRGACASSNVPRKVRVSPSYPLTLRHWPKIAIPPSRITSASSMACSPISLNLRSKVKEPVLRNAPLAERIGIAREIRGFCVGSPRHRRF